MPLDGANVLGLGAGTGVASRAALAAGAAVVVAVDISVGMLRRSGSLRPVLAEACALPFLADSFDLVVAAISLGHVTDPVRALRETRRVGGAMLVSVFEAGWPHPAKASVTEALASFGYRPPPWYEVLKHDGVPQLNDPAHLAAVAMAAGYRDVSVRTVPVATGVDTPAQLARWRLGMAHVAYPDAIGLRAGCSTGGCRVRARRRTSARRLDGRPRGDLSTAAR